MTATGTPAPTFTATGLPTGLSIDGSTGVISGTPPTPGTSTVTITASNGTTPDDTQTVTITVQPAATTSPTPTPTAPASTPTTPAGTPNGTTGGGSGTPTGELAFTGSDPTLPLGIAGALLAAGIALTAVARSRRRAARV